LIFEESMENIDEIRNQLALERLNADFIFYLDNNEISSLVDLFTHDAQYSHGARVTNGHKELQVLFGKRLKGEARVSRHLQTGLRINFSSENEAIGQSVCLTFAGNRTPPFQGADPLLIADFEDEYQRDENGIWKINSRRIHRIFESPGSQPYGTSKAG